MYISYYDESGDDGYPVFSSTLFCLSAIYMHHSYWKSNYNKILFFRRQIKDEYNFPINQEFHCRQFIMDKNPYHGMYSAETRREIFNLYIDLMATLKIKIINVVIDKSNIGSRPYDVLESAFTYSIQRIENSLKKIDEGASYMIFCDKGRVGKMRKTSRKIQRINFIPSKLNPGQSYRREIDGMIEDPIEKDSRESYFIQISDIVAYTVYLYSTRHLMRNVGDWAKRVRNVLMYGDEISAMDRLKPVLNTMASSSNQYGIVYYPK